MLAIIPARKGSKGLKGKNIKLINNKPLISHTIEAALKSKKVKDIFISTDDKRIVQIAKKYNIKIPYLRPKRLASDRSPAIQTYLHTIDYLNKNKKEKIKNFVVLLPTAPLRKPKDIDNAISLFFKKKADSVISMCKTHHPIEWQKKIDKKKKIKSIFKDLKSTYNRQKLKTTYLPNGSIYVFNYKFLKKKLNYYSKKSFAYVMPKISSYDIDDKLDFEIIKNILNK